MDILTKKKSPNSTKPIKFNSLNRSWIRDVKIYMEIIKINNQNKPKEKYKMVMSLCYIVIVFERAWYYPKPHIDTKEIE